MAKVKIIKLLISIKQNIFKIQQLMCLPTLEKQKKAQQTIKSQNFKWKNNLRSIINNLNNPNNSKVLMLQGFKDILKTKLNEINKKMIYYQVNQNQHNSLFDVSYLQNESVSVQQQLTIIQAKHKHLIKDFSTILSKKSQLLAIKKAQLKNNYRQNAQLNKSINRQHQYPIYKSFSVSNIAMESSQSNNRVINIKKSQCYYVEVSKILQFFLSKGQQIFQSTKDLKLSFDSIINKQNKINSLVRQYDEYLANKIKSNINFTLFKQSHMHSNIKQILNKSLCQKKAFLCQTDQNSQQSNSDSKQPKQPTQLQTADNSPQKIIKNSLNSLQISDLNTLCHKILDIQENTKKNTNIQQEVKQINEPDQSSCLSNTSKRTFSQKFINIKPKDYIKEQVEKQSNKQFDKKPPSIKFANINFDPNGSRKLINDISSNRGSQKAQNFYQKSFKIPNQSSNLTKTASLQQKNNLASIKLTNCNPTSKNSFLLPNIKPKQTSNNSFSSSNIFNKSTKVQNSLLNNKNQGRHEQNLMIREKPTSIKLNNPFLMSQKSPQSVKIINNKNPKSQSLVTNLCRNSQTIDQNQQDDDI